jgi:hypothetical protein
VQPFDPPKCKHDTMLGLFNRLFGRQKTTLPPFDFKRNRFRARKNWPPNLRELTERQQFRFERKFKRRIKLKSARPVWNKWIGIVQWSSISFIVVWGVFFHDFAKDPMNPRPGEQPFVALREWMWGKIGNFYTHTDDNLGGARGARRGDGLLAREEAEPGGVGERKEVEGARSGEASRGG